MARNKTKFRNDLTKAFENATNKAMKASFHTEVDGNETTDSMTTKIAKKYSEIFAMEFGSDVPKIFDEYLDSLEFDTSKLTAAGSPVAGILKIV